MELIDKIKDVLKPGDILFSRVGGFLYSRVAAVSQSWVSHVGIAFLDEKGEWMVSESAVFFSQVCTLENFLSRSEDDKIAIRRLKRDLTEDEVLSLKAEADKRMGKLYCLGFNYNSSRTYCSKFVYDVYQAALGVEVGKKETFKELIGSNPGASKTFWRFWFFGFIPWKRITVTPASQYRDERLETVFENVES